MPQDHMPFRIPDTFTVRVAGMPLDVMARLRFDRTMRLVRDILQVQRSLECRSGPLSDQLYDVVGVVDDRMLRRRLVALRRDVYAARMPQNGPPDETLLRSVPEALAIQLAEWSRSVQHRRDLHARARSTLEAEQHEKRVELWRAAGDTGFQQGIAFASRDFYPGLSAWTASPPRPDGKLERRLVRYLGRMAAKTSPYSTFTSWAFGRWSTGSGRTVADPTSMTRRSAVELDTSIRRQISDAVAALPLLRGRLPLQVNDSVVVDGTHLRFLDGTGSETIRELPNTPTLQRFLQEIRQGVDRSYNGVVHALACLETNDRHTEIAAFLDKLLDIGLVQTGFGIPDDAPDPLGQLADALEPYDDNQVRSIQAALRQLRQSLTVYAETRSSAERFERRHIIQRELTQLYRILEHEHTNQEFSKAPFHEDAVLTGADFQLRAENFKEVLADLDLVRRLAGLYDRFLPGQLAAESFFSQYYGLGATVPFLTFYRVFCAEIRQPAGWRDGYAVSGRDLLTCYDEPFPVPQLPLRRMTELRELQDRLIGCVAEHHFDGSHTRLLDRRRIQDFADHLPDFVAPITSMACYCQIMGGGNQPSVVVNELTCGFGRSRAKALRSDSLTRRDGRESRADRNSRSPRQRYAAVAGGASGSNLNLTYPTTDYEIVYPGSVSRHAYDTQLSLRDLLVTHDARAGRLRLVSRSSDMEVIPVHLGLMVEFLLPSAYRFLIQIFGQAPPRFEFLKQLGTAAPDYAGASVHSFPRLRIGSVVLNRRSWTVHSDTVPVAGKGEAELDYLLRLQQWRTTYNIPEQCFVRVFPPPADNVHTARVAGLRNKARKPMYVDFASNLSIRAFEHVMRSSDGLVVLEEMLPAHQDQIVHDGENSYVSEFAFELDDGECGNV